MAVLAPIAPKIAKLIPRLATDHDGEVVATVRAIERTLKNAGLDFHNLAFAIEAPPAEKIVFVYRDPPKQEAVLDTRAAVAAWCRDNDPDVLSTKETAFVADMAECLILDGEPTEKQEAWLRAIFAKLKRATRR